MQQVFENRARMDSKNSLDAWNVDLVVHLSLIDLFDANHIY